MHVRVGQLQLACAMSGCEIAGLSMYHAISLVAAEKETRRCASHDMAPVEPWVMSFILASDGVRE
jgi:hypothetical protein